MGRTTKKVIEVKADWCHNCSHQTKMNRHLKPKEQKKIKSIVIEDRNRKTTPEGKKFLKKLKKNGKKLNYYPTHYCSDLSCESVGALGNKAMRDLIKKNDKQMKNKQKTKKSPKKRSKPKKKTTKPKKRSKPKKKISKKNTKTKSKPKRLKKPKSKTKSKSKKK
jgi:hypothetical protein